MFLIRTILFVGCLFFSQCEKRLPEYYYCVNALPSHLAVGDTAVVVNVGDGYLPLYSEAAGTGGINGGLENGHIVTLTQEPVCSGDLVWWQVTDNGQTGMIYEFSYMPLKHAYIRYLMPAK